MQYRLADDKQNVGVDAKATAGSQEQLNVSLLNDIFPNSLPDLDWYFLEMSNDIVMSMT